MSDQQPTADEAVAEDPSTEPAPDAAPEPTPSWEATLPGGGEALAERPEVLVGAAFVGGVVAAAMLKRLVR